MVVGLDQCDGDSRRVREPWYATAFAEDYLEIDQHVHTVDGSARDVQRVLELLGAAQPARILDLCCGYGRHSLHLASLGYDVVGADLSPVLLERARNDALSQKLDVSWFQGDMRNLPFLAEFDAIVCLFNSIGYLESKSEDERALQSIRRYIRGSGRAVIQIGNIYQLIRNLRSTDWFQLSDRLLVLEKREFDVARRELRLDLSLLRDFRVMSTERYQMRMYSCSEMQEMLERSGFGVLDIFGGLDRSDLYLDSPSLVFICEPK